MQKNNIILIGMMGAGKSTIVQELGKTLNNFTIIDADSEIEKNEGTTITEIFKNKGEAYFRELETNTIREICKNSNQIIATGGGIFEKSENREILKGNGTVFYLKATPENLYDRIKLQTHRPLLKTGFGVQNIKEILNKREINYSKAQVVIDTNNKTLDEIVKNIIEKGNINE